MSSFNTNSISVIIPTYNRRPVLGRAIDSVLNQSKPADEIIIIDDGSTDDTDIFIKESYPHVSYLYQKNTGISSARNLGIRTAKGEWIAFLDSDDEWLPQKLEKQLDALNKQSLYKICHTNEIWIRHGRRVNQGKKHEKFGGEIFEKCLPLCVMSPSSVIIHRSVFDSFGLFDESLPVCEDYDLWLRISAFLPVLYLSEAQIIKYGGHSDQLSHKYWGIDRFRIQALEKIINMSDLSRKKKQSAIQMLLKKINIYLLGANKREKAGEVKYYTMLKEKYIRFTDTP